MSDRAIGLKEACQLLGYCHRHGQRLIANGTFPVPELPWRGGRTHHKFSLKDVESYLASALNDAKRGAA